MAFFSFKKDLNIFKHNWGMSFLLCLLISGILLISLFPQLYTVFPVNIYLTLHSIMEFLSVVISLAVSIVAWYNYRQDRELHEFLICLTFLAVGFIDFAHTMSYNGMPDFFTPNSVNKASTYWIAARLIQAVGMLGVASANHVKTDSKFKHYIYLILTLLFSVVILACIAARNTGLPLMFEKGIGQTQAKVFLEYLVISIELAALFYLLYRKGKSTSEIYLEAALLLGIFSEVAFTMYSSAYDTYNLVGHIYKIGAFTCILRGLFITSVVRLHVANRVLREQRRKLNEINAQLARVNKLKTDFLANTNHELRTPLTAIVAFTELLMDKETGPLNAVQQDYLQEINDSSQKLLAEINNLLDLAKIEAGQARVHSETASLSEILTGVLRHLRPVFRQKNHCITTIIPPNLPLVVIDVEKIKKVFINLLSNAHKFTPPGGNITVEASVSQDGNSLTVDISDNGIGMTEVHAAHIFDMFYQVENSLTKQHHGTGLGLTLVKHFIELHGGRVGVRSDPGIGSTFSLVLPLNYSNEEAV